MLDDERTAERRPLLTGMFRDRESAERAYGWLAGRGYTRDEVTVLMSQDAHRRHFGDAHNSALASKAAEGAGVGAAVGGGLGAIIAGLAAAGTIALPGVGLVALGPLAAAFAGGAVGVASGGILGGLIGAGIPEERAREYEGGIREGGILIGVTPHSDEDAEHVEREWQAHRGAQVFRDRRDAA